MVGDLLKKRSHPAAARSCSGVGKSDWWHRHRCVEPYARTTTFPGHAARSNGGAGGRSCGGRRASGDGASRRRIGGRSGGGGEAELHGPVRRSDGPTPSRQGTIARTSCRYSAAVSQAHVELISTKKKAHVELSRCRFRVSRAGLRFFFPSECK